MTVHLDEGTFLPDRKKRRFGNNQGYSITNNTDLKEFIDTLNIDFEQFILPELDKPITVRDCLEFYGKFGFWGNNLKRQLKELGLIEKE